MSSSKTLNIIYDGHCGFCIRALNLISALDTRRMLHLYDAHQPETLVSFPELRNADVEDAMYTVAAAEPLYRGFFAFRRLMWAGPLLWPFLPLFYFPGASLLGPPLYSWVARNRTRLGCRSDFCALPTAPRIKGTR
jgi:predicted DCC family thiol-disulfide oxidoreductase YuxK